MNKAIAVDDEMEIDETRILEGVSSLAPYLSYRSKRGGWGLGSFTTRVSVR